MAYFFKNNALLLRFFGILLPALFLAGTVQAQLRYGFKTGLNFSRMDGPSEISTAGADLESWKTLTGFHIGLSLGYAFTDAFGVRGEVLYTKKGAKYTYDGESYRIFRYDGGSTLSTGNSRYLINVTNAYMDIPVQVYGRWKDLEFSGGAYAGFLLQSTGEGSLSYTNGRTSTLGNSIQDVEFNLNHNYRKDKPGLGEGGDVVLPNVDGRVVELPKTLGAYDYPEDKGKLYNSLDFGLTAGVAYYMSSSLFVGFRLQYGLADVTNNTADLAKSTTDNGTLLFRDDKDRNVVMQLSVGFGF
ncbi:MAG: outer membrane beta-barrel protein [Lewinellaceae bacterium]|nr:outer membrane beta-barrel protein [Lewinellaceae bacterium]